MRTRIDVLRACLSIVLAVAMLLSTMIVFTGKAAAEPVVESELSITETPPIPPYTIWGTIYDENNVPVSDATLSVMNIRTGESLDAETFENGF